MSKNTPIQWTDSTINPVMGCSGCELWNDERKTCFTGNLHRLRRHHKGFSPNFLSPKLFAGRTSEAAAWGDLTGTTRLDKPWLDSYPRLIFVSDMGDALSEKGAIDSNNNPVPGGEVPFEFLKTEIVDAAASEKGRRHRWLWLTKRPGRLVQFCTWLERAYGLSLPENIWIGTSITNQGTLGRIAQLQRAGGEKTVRFLSVEPLWEQISLVDHLSGIRWVIVGGESRQGSPAKEFRCDWARKLRDECKKMGTAFFVKQLGSNAVDRDRRLILQDGHGGDWLEWPHDLRIREMPLLPDLSRVEPRS